jgi:hypothetical protein
MKELVKLNLMVIMSVNVDAIKWVIILQVSRATVEISYTMKQKQKLHSYFLHLRINGNLIMKRKLNKKLWIKREIEVAKFQCNCVKCWLVYGVNATFNNISVTVKVLFFVGMNFRGLVKNYKFVDS